MIVESEGAARPYRAALIDEAQDLHPEQWRLLRALIPPGANDLFLVGDAHQRIYARKLVLSRVGVSVRGRSHTLRVQYRTREPIRHWAVNARPGSRGDAL